MQNNANSCQNGRINSFTQVGERRSRQESCSTKKRDTCSQENSQTQMRNMPRFGGEEVRMVDPMIDIIFPAVAFPSNKIYKTIGEMKVREMVAYHHELLFKTKVGKLFPANKDAQAMVVNATADFFVEALGGEEVFTQNHGEPRLRLRHFKIPIDESDREIWLAMYKKTLKELAFPREHLEEFWNWIEPLSIRMINRRTNMDAIKRHHWHDVKDDFKIIKEGVL